MPIHSDRNLYPGINPHLNSRLQQRNGGWKGFHSQHLTHINEALEKILPGNYYTAGEESLQIGTYDLLTDLPIADSEFTVPDLTIYQSETSARTEAASSGPLSSPTLELPVARYFEDEEFIGSLIIYRIEGSTHPGKPVTRIELLSPANKAPGSHYETYLSKRMQTLQSGLRLVEIDYLHERRPVIPGIPSYPDHHNESHPYSVIVSDPRPNVLEGLTRVYGFGILDTMPVVPIPLEGGDYVALDFGQIYTHTVESSRLFRRILVDYEQEPVNFTAYNAADFQLIQEKMREIASDYSVQKS